MSSIIKDMPQKHVKKTKIKILLVFNKTDLSPITFPTWSDLMSSCFLLAFDTCRFACIFHCVQMQSFCECAH